MLHNSSVRVQILRSNAVKGNTYYETVLSRERCFKPLSTWNDEIDNFGVFYNMNFAQHPDKIINIIIYISRFTCSMVVFTSYR